MMRVSSAWGGLARGALALLACCWTASALAAQPTAAEKQAIGLTALQQALGSAAPTGAGITVSQIEAPQSGEASQYFVNTALDDFAGKSIVAKQSPATASNHATNMAQNLYGNSGIAPGVNTIDVYEANQWFGSGFLRANTAQAPRYEVRDVQNHSWIANFTVDDLPNLEYATDVLRRLDYVVNRDGVVAVAGVNNGSNTAIPQILGNAYNVIAVGRSDGLSSAGPSTVDGVGRSKPDIVAPGYNASVSTAWVSAAAALLLESAAGNAAASRPATIKALLLAGASKAPFDLDGKTPSTLDDWSRTTTQPLDDRLGAGQLDIFRSHHILTAGQQAPSDVSNVAHTGWDARTISSGQELTYYFTIPENYVAIDVSILAAWNREIDFQPGSGPIAATLTPSLANIDLSLTKAEGFITGSLIDESVSTIDNVEHIFQRVLRSGQYGITVTSDSLAEFSLAWDAKLVLAGDLNFDGVVDGADYVVWANNFGQSGKQYWEGDFNLDGVVDGADYVVWANNFSSATSAAMPMAAHAVPEPSSLALLLLATCVAVASSRRRWLHGE